MASLARRLLYDDMIVTPRPGRGRKSNPLHRASERSRVAVGEALDPDLGARGFVARVAHLVAHHAEFVDRIVAERPELVAAGLARVVGRRGAARAGVGRRAGRGPVIVAARAAARVVAGRPAGLVDVPDSSVPLSWPPVPTSGAALHASRHACRLGEQSASVPSCAVEWQPLMNSSLPSSLGWQASMIWSQAPGVTALPSSLEQAPASRPETRPAPITTSRARRVMPEGR